MERFLAFYGANYYPNGGIKDLVGDYATLTEATSAVEEKLKSSDSNDWRYNWSHIYDSLEKKVVWMQNDYDFGEDGQLLDILK